MPAVSVENDQAITILLFINDVIQYCSIRQHTKHSLLDCSNLSLKSNIKLISRLMKQPYYKPTAPPHFVVFMQSNDVK